MNNAVLLLWDNLKARLKQEFELYSVRKNEHNSATQAPTKMNAQTRAIEAPAGALHSNEQTAHRHI